MSIKLSPKAPAIEATLNRLFPNRGTGTCVFCSSTKTDETDFKDDASRKEFSISAMCQVCQDDFFDSEEE